MVSNFDKEVMLSRIRFVIVVVELAKDIMKKFTNTGWQDLTGRLSFLALSLVTMLAMSGGIAKAQPVNDNFASATTISGLAGSVTGNNSGATIEPKEVSPVTLSNGNGPVNVTNSIWFQW